MSKHVVAEAKHEEKKIGGKHSLLWFYRANILDEEGSHANRYKTILVLFVERYTFPSAEVKQEEYLSCEEWLCAQGIDCIIYIKTIFLKGFYIPICLSLGHPPGLNIEKWLLQLWTEILTGVSYFICCFFTKSVFLKQGLCSESKPEPGYSCQIW